MNVLEAQGLTVKRGGVSVVSGVDLIAKEGLVLGLIGPNGAGKTSLLRALCRLETAAEGQIKLAGVPINSLDRVQLAKTVAYCAQGSTCHWPLLVKSLVSLGRIPHLTPRHGTGLKDRDIINRALHETDTAHLSSRAVDTLSGGELARALLARALAVEASVLLADEPIASLDPRYQLQIMTILRNRARAGTAVICVLHDLSLAARFCDFLVLMHGGRIHSKGTPDAVLVENNLANTFGIHAVTGRFQEELYLIPWGQVPGSNFDEGG